MRKRFSRDESGAAAIIEATFVYPLVFAVLFFLIYAADMYYQRAQIQYLVAHYATTGALEQSGAQEVQMTKLSDGTYSFPANPPDLAPYRFIVDTVPGIMGCKSNSLTTRLESELTRGINKTSIFSLETSKQVSVQYCPGLMYSDFKVSARYMTTVPFFSGWVSAQKYDTNQESVAPVVPMAEFARNIDFLDDIFLANLGAYESIGSKGIELITSAVDSVASVARTLGIGRSC